MSGPRHTPGGGGRPLSHWRRDPRPSAELAQRVANRIFGTFCILIGAFLLSGFWQLGPELWKAQKEFEEIIGVREGRIERSWWWIDFCPELVGDAGFARGAATYWGPITAPEFCVRVRYYHPSYGDASAVACWRFGRVRSEWMFYENALLALYPDDVPAPWIDDTGSSLLELRYSARAHRWLSEHEPASWHLLPQTDAGRESAAEGKVIDALWIAVDEPLDHMLRDWSRPGGRMVVAYHPERPGWALPVPMLVTALAPPSEPFAPYALGGFGLFLWFFGWVRFFGGKARILGWVVALGTLATLPLWGGRITDLIGKESLVATMAIMPEPPALLFKGADESIEEGVVRRPWSFKTSFYTDVLSGLEIVRPRYATSPDDVLRALADSVSRQVLELAEEEQVRLFERLRDLNEQDRTEIRFLFIDVARRLSLASDGTPGMPAISFLPSLPIRPVLSHVRAFETKLGMWKALVGHPDNGLANTARAVVEQSEER